MKGYILILGAKSSIARALAREYAAHGYNLYLAARQAGQLADDCADLMTRYGVDARALEFDLLNFGGHKDFFRHLAPKPAGVICAAGYLGNHPSAMRDFEESAKIILTNFMGPVSILNVVADYYEKDKSGFIVGIGSVAGDRGRKGNYIYGAAKGAFAVYLSGLRNRLAGSGARVLTVKPGFVATKMTEGLNLPPALTASPEEAARDIFGAQQRGKDVLYTKWFWKFIMYAIIHIPERIFKKMNL